MVKIIKWVFLFKTIETIVRSIDLINAVAVIITITKSFKNNVKL